LERVVEPAMGIPGEQGKPKLSMFGKWLCRPFEPRPRELNKLTVLNIPALSP